MAESSPPKRDFRNILVFASRTGIYAIDPAWVVHVSGSTVIRPTPFSGRALLGLARYGGEPLPVLSFDTLIDEEEPSARDRTPVIVLQYGEDGNRRRIGLAVEEILEMMAVEDPEEIKFDGRPVSQTFRCGGRDLAVVDVGALVCSPVNGEGVDD